MDAINTEPQETPPTKVCPLCGAALSDKIYRINSKLICEGCFGKIQSEISAQKPTPINTIISICGGLMGAIVGAGIWTTVTIQMNLEVGYIAILVGFLAGKGTTIVQKSRGKPVQIVALVCAVLGVIIAKYAAFAILAHQAFQAQGVEMSFFSSSIANLFIASVSKIASPFDALWIFLAGRVAWRIPRATRFIVKK